MSKELNNSEHSRAKVNRGVAALTVLSLLATGCVATEQGGQVVAKIPDEPTKTSPLSPDLTKTPTLSLTEAPVKLSPTKMVTEMSTLTLTPEPTATPEATKDVYEIDLEKFNTMPLSYEDVVANPEKYQEAPDFFGDTEVAMKWWKETLIPTLGDQRELIPNVFGGAWTNDEVRFDYVAMGREEALLSDYPAFYFKHDNEIYLVPVFTLQFDNGNTGGTFAVILYKSANDGYIGGEGLGEVKNIYEGKKIIFIQGIKKASEHFILPGDVKNFVMSEHNWAGLEEHAMTGIGYLIGVGAIDTIPN